MHENNLTKYRLRAMMSPNELAKAAGVSVITVKRIEEGNNYHLGTIRKIMKSLREAYTKLAIDAPPSVEDVFPNYEQYVQEKGKAAREAKEPEKVVSKKPAAPVTTLKKKK